MSMCRGVRGGQHLCHQSGHGKRVLADSFPPDCLVCSWLDKKSICRIPSKHSITKRNKKARTAEKEKYEAPIEDLTNRWNVSRQQRAPQFISLNGASEVASHETDPTTESLKSAPASPLPLLYLGAVNCWIMQYRGPAWPWRP